MIAVRGAALSLRLLLLVHLVGVQVFEQVPLLPLIITDVEGVARHVVLLLPVEVLNHGQSIIIRALLHGGCIARSLLDALTKAVLVLDLLSGRVRHRRLHHTISVCLHYFLA